MLGRYALHELAWDACDERFGGVQVASPDDAGGRRCREPDRCGNGAVWVSNKTAYSYLRIDTADTPGYITVG